MHMKYIDRLTRWFRTTQAAAQGTPGYQEVIASLQQEQTWIAHCSLVMSILESNDYFKHELCLHRYGYKVYSQNGAMNCSVASSLAKKCQEPLNCFLGRPWNETPFPGGSRNGFCHLWGTDFDEIRIGQLFELSLPISKGQNEITGRILIGTCSPVEIAKVVEERGPANGGHEPIGEG